MRDAWRLAKPYWTSEEKSSARGLLLAVIALDLGRVYISVRINAWNNAFYNALQAFNSGELFRQLGIFCVLVAFAIAMSVSALYLNQMVQIRWRRWLTCRYLRAWLADQAYYQLQLRNTTDNPDGAGLLFVVEAGPSTYERSVILGKRKSTFCPSIGHQLF